jgi:hypothetical protein
VADRVEIEDYRRDALGQFLLKARHAAAGKPTGSRSMASSKLCPWLPFGYREPSERDVGVLGRDLLAAARDRPPAGARQRWSCSCLASCSTWPSAPACRRCSWALRVHLDPAATVALTTASFLLLALLGQHYRSQMTLESLASGYGHIHRVLLPRR